MRCPSRADCTDIVIRPWLSDERQEEDTVAGGTGGDGPITPVVIDDAKLLRMKASLLLSDLHVSYNQMVIVWQMGRDAVSRQ